MGGEESAPAHSDGGKNGDGVSVQDSGLIEGRKQAKCRSDGAEGRHGERYQPHVGKAEQPFEHPVYLPCEPWQDRHSLVCGAGITSGTRPEGDEDNHGSDDEHAGDDGEAEFHTVLAAVEYGIEETQEHAVRGLVLLSRHFFDGPLASGRVKLRECLEAAALHDAGRDYGTAESACETDQRAGGLAKAYHGDYHHETHSESGAEIGQRKQLVLLEIGRKLLVLGKGDDSRIV